MDAPAVSASRWLILRSPLPLGSKKQPARKRMSLTSLNRNFRRPRCVSRLPRPGENAGMIGPRFPQSRHRLEAIRPLSGQVVQLGAVRLHIVKFPLASGALRHQLPATIADGAIAFVLEEDRLVAIERLTGERGPQADALQRQGLLALAGVGIFSAGDIKASRHDINQVTWLLHQRAARL